LHDDLLGVAGYTSPSRPRRRQGMGVSGRRAEVEVDPDRVHVAGRR